MASMILRDYNHPSVIMWCVGNEIILRPLTFLFLIRRK
ncbi:glycoside hydrolase family 2 TIM barrel-domain containing protein [Paenibacillus sanguinis]